MHVNGQLLAPHRPQPVFAHLQIILFFPNNQTSFVYFKRTLIRELVVAGKGRVTLVFRMSLNKAWLDVQRRQLLLQRVLPTLESVALRRHAQSKRGSKVRNFWSSFLASYFQLESVGWDLSRLRNEHDYIVTSLLQVFEQALANGGNASIEVRSPVQDIGFVV